MSKIFITGSDTDAGKTWVTASIMHALLEQGVSAKALKPVACGYDAGCNADIEALLAAQKLSDAEQINRYRFTLPAAPSQAAAAEGLSVDPSGLVQWCHDQSGRVEICLIEGVGGLMTPITDTWFVADWIEAMPECDVWLVVGCKLGAINQTLLTLSKLKQMHRSPARVFFNAVSAEHNAWIEPTLGAVAPFLNSDCEISMLKFGERPGRLCCNIRVLR